MDPLSERGDLYPRRMGQARRSNSPNPNDPLAETTPGRRCVAALIRKHGNKSAAARALGKGVGLFDGWETGLFQPSRDNLRMVAQSTGYTLEQLTEGRDVGDSDRVNKALTQIEATAEERELLSVHARGAGRFYVGSDTYVVGYIHGIRQARARGEGPADAESSATTAAGEARNEAAAKKAGGKRRASTTLKKKPR